MKLVVAILRFERHMKEANRLVEAGILSTEELRSAKRVVFFRNLIAHEYYRITEEDQNLQKLSSFVEKAKKIKE
ncbi:MAG: hypothetical protein DRP23_06445 [Thermotogae bacterium]|nr:MAG: hypothetical protein DRP23_06445 [Thermotogota bacterium]